MTKERSNSLFREPNIHAHGVFFRGVRALKIAPKIISLQNLVISEINFIISHVGFESAKCSTPVRPLFIVVILLLRDNEIMPENKYH